MQDTSPYQASAHRGINRFLAWLVVALGVYVFPAQATAQQASGEVLIVSQDHAWPPFSYLNADGEPKGLLIDLWREIGSELDRPVEFRLVDWPDSIEQIRNGEAHVHGGLLTSEERREFLQFSEPLAPLRTFLFVASSAPNRTIESLSGSPVGVVEGSFEQEFLGTQHPDLVQVSFDNNETMVLAANRGEISFFAADYPVAMYLLDRHSEPSQFHPMVMLYSQPLLAGVPLDDPLLDEVNAAITALGPETLRRINQRWVRSEPVEVVPAWLQPLAIGLGLLVISSYIGLLIWQRRRLTKLVAKRTHELVESEQMFRTLTRGSSAGIYIVSSEDFYFVNPALCELVGYEEDELMRKPFLDIVHEDDRETVRQRHVARHAGDTNVPRQYSIRIQRKDGELRWVNLTADIIHVAGKTCSTGTVIDITEHLDIVNNLAYQGEFDRMVAEISSDFMTTDLNSLDTSIHKMLRLTGELFKADRAFLMQFDDEMAHMTTDHEWCNLGIQSSTILADHTPLTDYPWLSEQISESIESRQILAINDIDQLPDYALTEHRMFARNGVKSLLCIPIITTDRTIGFIGFESLTARAWPEELAERLQVIAKLLSDALTSAEQEASLTTHSITDPLTGLYNRRFLEADLNNRLRAFQDKNIPFCVALFDLDHFKRLNDTYGHLCGDEVLRQFSDLLTHYSRANDVAARFGGEEFILVLEKCELEPAIRSAQRILDATADQDFTVDGQVHHVTVSCGIASIRELEDSDQTITQLIELADRRLYHAKDLGRGRIG